MSNNIQTSESTTLDQHEINEFQLPAEDEALLSEVLENEQLAKEDNNELLLIDPKVVKITIWQLAKLIHKFETAINHGKQLISFLHNLSDEERSIYDHYQCDNPVQFIEQAIDDVRKSSAADKTEVVLSAPSQKASLELDVKKKFVPTPYPQ